MCGIGVVQAVDGPAVHLPPQPIKVVEAVVLLIDDDDMVERVYRRGAVRLRNCRLGGDGGKGQNQISNIHCAPPENFRKNVLSAFESVSKNRSKCAWRDVHFRLRHASNEICPTFTECEDASRTKLPRYLWSQTQMRQA